MTPDGNPLIPGNLEDFGKIVFTLIGELWIARDRIAVLEQLLVDRAVIQPGEVDDYAPTPAMSAQLETLRDRMVGALFGATLMKEGMGVDAVLDLAGMARPKTTERADA